MLLIISLHEDVGEDIWSWTHANFTSIRKLVWLAEIILP